MFYGQFGEDQYMSNFFDNDYKGVCIDVGAYDGVNSSNSYYFEKIGWYSLCIEPIPESFIKCNSVRKHTINCCVSNYDKDNVEFSIVRLEGNNVSAISSLTIDERLIETHKHLINNIEKISVKVKCLNTIFQEENIPKNIDFISIDTENTEIDVLKGIDFNIYNVNFLIIENNFNENIIQDYLKTKNFKKFNRIAVNDFYVNNNYLNIEIHNCFKIKHANYYISENEEYGNVTYLLIILLRCYMTNNKNNIMVCNALFKDTCINSFKKLFITFENKNTNQIIKFVFDEGSLLDFDMIFNELNKYNISSQSQLIEVSIGEIADKYSILELKNKYITDTNKLNEIKKEIDILKLKVSETTQSYFYKLLLHINEQIWLDTDKIRNINMDLIENYKNLYIELSRKIFDNNQKRFRLKNYFNILENSNIKECKSYSDNNCFIIISNEDDIYDKIPEINYLLISYDIIYFNINYKEIINKLFKNPNKKFIEQNNLDISIRYELSLYKLSDNIRVVYDFNPIKYKSAGKLGDFLNQLSVVCEKFYDTGRKGELYITNMVQINDHFLFGLQYAYDDTYSVISSQKYIKKYEIYTNQNLDIDLSEWRNNISYFVSLNYSWYNIYTNVYNINWGKHKWLTSSHDIKWNNKIIINITSYRFMSSDTINKLKNNIINDLENCIFISNEKEHHTYFCKNMDINIAYYKPINFEETVLIINSCKISYLGFSSMAVIANGLHKEHYLIGANDSTFNVNNYKHIMPHVLDIFI